MNTEKRKNRKGGEEKGEVQIVRYSLQSQQVLDKNWQ